MQSTWYNSRRALHSAAIRVFLDCVQINARSALCSITACRRPLLYELTRHGQKGFFHVFGRFCRSFNVGYAEFVRKFLGLLFRHNPIGRAIAFVAHQQFDSSGCRVAVDFFQPIVHVVKGFCGGDIEDHDDTVRSAIVGGRDGAKALLPGRVPNLQFDRFLVNFQRAKAKIDANGTNVRLCKGIVLSCLDDEQLAESTRMKNRTDEPHVSQYLE